MPCSTGSCTICARFCALMLDGVEYQEEPLINGFCGVFYRAQNDLGSSPERQRESASLRSPAVRLGWPRIRFQTITSEYHRGGRAALLAEHNATRSAWCGV